MTKTLLKLLNLPGLLLLALLGIGIQTSLFQFWPFQYFQPDFLLIIVIWVALRRSFWEGGWITLLIADFAELHSAVPQGTFLISYMGIYLAVRSFSRMAVLPNLYSLVSLTLFASMLWKLGNLGILQSLGVSNSSWKHTVLLLFPGAVIEGLTAIWTYRLLDRYDTLTHRAPKREQNITAGLEEELLLYDGAEVS